MARQTSTSLRFLRKSVDLKIAVKAYDSQIASPLTVPIEPAQPETLPPPPDREVQDSEAVGKGDAVSSAPLSSDPAVPEIAISDTQRDVGAPSPEAIETMPSLPDPAEDNHGTAFEAERALAMAQETVEQTPADLASAGDPTKGSALSRPWRWLRARLRSAIYRNVTRRVVEELDHNADVRIIRLEERLQAAFAEAVSPVRGDVLWLHAAVRDMRGRLNQIEGDVQGRLDRAEAGIRGDVLWLHTAARELRALVERAEQGLRGDVMWLHNASRELRGELDLRFADAGLLQDHIVAFERALEANRERSVRELGIKVLAETNYLRLQLHAALEALESDMEARFDAHILPLVERFDASRVKDEDNIRQVSQAVHADIADARTTILNQLAASLAELPSQLSTPEPIAPALERIETYAFQAARRGTTNCGPWVMVRTAVGYVLCPESDTALIANLVDANEMEPGTRALIERLLEPGQCFVDIGANIGLHTIAAARRVGTDGHVFAFEPFPATKEALDESLWLNGLSSIVSVAQVAIFSRQGQQQLFLGRTSGHHSLFSEVIQTPTDQSVLVQTAMLDSLIPAGHQVHLIKIDVEGAELEVLKGAQRVLSENPHLMLIVEFGLSHLEQRGIDPEQWIRAFRQSGFTEMFGIDETTGSIEPMTAGQVVYRENINLLLRRDLKTSND